ncbi:MAG: 50S ribosomal protein L9 [Deltaproteobacteria bacterium]|nr:50S ribosomal protein L9 [Deltaproteobacteria bacterium]
MKLILTEDVPSLGSIGSIVSVKGGYGRNFLLPRGFAVPANESNTKQLEHHKRVLKAKKEKVLAEKRALAAKIEKLSLEVAKQVGEDERIFGSVTNHELAELLEKQGYQIPKKDIHIPEAVRTVGVYTADVRLHTEVVAQLKFWVVSQ